MKTTEERKAMRLAVPFFTLAETIEALDDMINLEGPEHAQTA